MQIEVLKTLFYDIICFFRKDNWGIRRSCPETE